MPTWQGKPSGTQCGYYLTRAATMNRSQGDRARLLYALPP
jgi:hypothetical protein